MRPVTLSHSGVMIKQALLEEKPAITMSMTLEEAKMQISAYSASLVPMMTPASRTPSITASTLDLKSISRKLAASVPVQAPVPGSGMATSRHSPRGPYFCTRWPFRWALFSNLVIKRSSRTLIFRSQAKIRRMNTMIKGTGSRFPSTAAARTARAPMTWSDGHTLVLVSWL